MSTYYARHKEEILAQQKEYREANRDYYLQYHHQYYKEKLKAKRNLQRGHNASRWSVKPAKIEPRIKPPRVAAPVPPAKSKRRSRRAVLVEREPGPVVMRLPGRVIDWT